MKYKIVGNFHLWGWICLKEKLDGVIVEYEMEENHIVEMIIQTKIKDELAKDIIKSNGGFVVKSEE